MNESYELVRTFAAKAADGKSYLVQEFHIYREIRTIHASAPARGIAGKAYRLASGEPVDSLGSGRYEIVGSSVELVAT